MIYKFELNKLYLMLTSLAKTEVSLYIRSITCNFRIAKLDMANLKKFKYQLTFLKRLYSL